MGVLGKLFGNKGKVQAKKPVKKQIVGAESNEIATLSYGYHTIPVEAFRQGIKKGATIKAFCDKSGEFIPLSQLGDTLLLSDPSTNTVSPLIDYEGDEYQDIYNYVYANNNSRHDYDDDYDDVYN